MQRYQSKQNLLTVLAASSLLASQAAALELDYDVEYGGKIVGNQSVAVEKTGEKGGRTRLTAQSKMEAEVFFSTYKFEDRLSAVFEGGRVVEYDYQANDNGKKTEITARSQDGQLAITKKAGNKTTNLTVSKDQYALTSWSLFCDPALSFLPRDAPSATLPVLVLEEAALVKQTITKKTGETIRVAGKEFACTPVTWKKGSYVSQSWHASDLNGLPVKYVLVDESGKSTLLLKKW
jgi:hypothetical protein